MTDTCTYIGDGAGCTHAVVLGRSYCTDHLWLVYKEGTAQHRKKDKKTAQAVWDLEAEFMAAVEQLMEEGYNFDEPRWEVEEEA
jgi:hypothetical protein